METINTASSNNITEGKLYLVLVQWKGKLAYLQSSDEMPCSFRPRYVTDLEGREYWQSKCVPEVMHHLGEDGKHYCPTTFIWCPACGAIGDEPEPYECHKRGVL